MKTQGLVITNLCCPFLIYVQVLENCIFSIFWHVFTPYYAPKDTDNISVLLLQVGHY